jgi:hypothetical protein
MPTIKKRYILDEKKQPVGVVLDLQTFKKIEDLLEDHFLGKIMEELDEEEALLLPDAKKYYAKLKKR